MMEWFDNGFRIGLLLVALVAIVLFQAGVIWSLLRKRKNSRPVAGTSGANTDQLHTWLLHAPIPICVFNKSGETVAVNERFTELLGYDTSDFKDTNEMWSILIQDESNREEYVSQWLEQTKQARSSRWQAEEVVVTAKSGRSLVIEAHLSEIGDFWVCLHNDVTWRNQVERELEGALNETFNANVAKTQFLTNMSHEIRTPLNGVLGMAQLMSETKMNEDQQLFVKTIQTSGEMLLMTINDILDLSKTESGGIELEASVFDFRKCVEDAVEICLPKLNCADVEFSHHLEPAVPSRLYGDPYRISQIVVNLLSNAFKYTHKGSVSLMVQYSRHGGSPDEMRIVVKDTGIGIPLEKQASIFEPFTQADASNTRQYGGNGLGLTICKRLADLMNGEITVMSLPGQGSEFCFSWCPESQDQSIPEDDVPEELANSSEPWKDPDFKTLVVEDNIVNLRVIELSLKKNGITIETASNGKEALEKIQKESFDLVFMDIQMPIMDGLRCTELIRKEIPKADQPFIIALTAHALADHMNQCRKAGINGFLAKPFTREELKKSLALFNNEKNNDRLLCFF